MRVNMGRGWAWLARQAGPGHLVQGPQCAGDKAHKVHYYLNAAIGLREDCLPGRAIANARPLAGHSRGSRGFDLRRLTDDIVEKVDNVNIVHNIRVSKTSLSPGNVTCRRKREYQLVQRHGVEWLAGRVH
jgi:hypothetical protein